MAGYHSLIEVICILVDALALLLASRTPKAIPPVDQKGFNLGWQQRLLSWNIDTLYLFFKTFYLTIALIEIAIVLSYDFNPSGIAAQTLFHIFMKNPDRANLLRITPLFAFGFLLSFSGAALHIWRVITSEIQATKEEKITKDYSLVIRGPYSLVRYPGHTAMLLTMVGGFFTKISPGSWVMLSGMLGTIEGWIVAYTAVIVGGWVMANVLMRIPMEDEMMRYKFGMEWDTWAKEVPFALWPGVY